ncbi:MAG: ATP-binding protein [Comamonadaceae bacterium]|nr:ATP-binding protein [Comamonadaceae bacterium]
MLGSGRYAEVDSSAVYARLRAVAMSALEAGYPVVVDAACLQRGQRDALRAVAAAAKAPFAILDCVARDEVLRERAGRQVRRPAAMRRRPIPRCWISCAYAACRCSPTSSSAQSASTPSSRWCRARWAAAWLRIAPVEDDE